MKQLTLLISLFLLVVGCNTAQDKNTITTIELKQLLAKEKIQLIDLRTPEEIEQGYIKSAKFVNFFDDNFTAKVSKITDKNKRVYLYCRSGNRSGKAAKLLEKEGFKVFNVEGGYLQWKIENNKE